MGQDKGGEHSEAVNNNLHIEQLENKAHQIGWFFLCRCICGRAAPEGDVGQIEYVGGAHIFHVGLNAGNDISKGTAENTAQTHECEGACPDAQHEAEIFFHAVLAGGGEQENIVWARGPHGHAGGDGHINKYGKWHKKGPFRKLL